MGTDIAIIGISGHFPGAKNVIEFWQNLKKGVEFSNNSEPNQILSFDPTFFGLTAQESQITNSQNLIFLECAWEILESAGYAPEKYLGNIGVFAGSDENTQNSTNPINNLAYLTTFASYKMNLRGPSMTIQTGCSSSLVAVHLACQSLFCNECDMALAGGIATEYISPNENNNNLDSEEKTTIFNRGSLGLVLLKKLDKAILDHDYIYAVLKGSAVNNDGISKANFATPSLHGQINVIASALEKAQINAGTISYIEADGKGNILNDFIEIKALSEVFEKSTNKKNFCAIGSVKANIGYTGSTSGIIGMIKAILCLKYATLVPTLPYQKSNPYIDFENSPFYVNTELIDWPKNEFPRRCGVSSFGIGGTNSHVILEEFLPNIEQSGFEKTMIESITTRPWKMITLSAKTPSALANMRTNLAEYLKNHPESSLEDIAYTLHIGREHFPHRCYFTSNSREQAIALLEDTASKKVSISHVPEKKDRSIAFIFSGQGAQYIQMGCELYQSEPVFHNEVNNCCEILKKHIGIDLRQILYPEKEHESEAAEKINQTSLTQPCLFVIEYSLAKLWMSWGIRPSVMVGHSIGEYIAACIAGVFSLEDALATVALRGKLMQSMPTGAMLAVTLPKEEVLPLLTPELCLATVNMPKLCVVSGTYQAIDELEKKLAGKSPKKLQTSHAFHSFMMDPILTPFIEFLRTIKLNTPQMPYYSNVSGKLIQAEEATNPEYWGKQLRQTVYFEPAIQEIFKSNPTQVILEVGPSRTLTGLLPRHPNKGKEHTILSSIRHPTDPESDAQFTLETLGKLFLADATIDWQGYYQHSNFTRLPLPTYPFEQIEP